MRENRSKDPKLGLRIRDVQDIEVRDNKTILGKWVIWIDCSGKERALKNIVVSHKELLSKVSDFFRTRYSRNINLRSFFNPLMPSGNKKITHT